jgi:hypothetical protein
MFRKQKNLLKNLIFRKIIRKKGYDLYEKNNCNDYQLKDAYCSSVYECYSSVIKLVNDLRKEYEKCKYKFAESADQR